ncbi:MAG: cytochrome c-type biogenesis protein CcmH [Henriciella sp.]|nr:cytochrome c-type biogenesis protein CcmH [Henriciella sp.]
MIKAATLALFMSLQSSGSVLDDPQEEARAQKLMREIRCVACENEPISQSASDIAEDMRDRVRVLIEEGKSDAEIRSWFVDRYGEFVLFRPDAEGVSGMLLWGLPFAILIAGAAVLIARRSTASQSEIDRVAPDHEYEIED